MLTKVSRRRFGRADGIIVANVAWESWLALALFFWARSVNWRQIQGLSNGKKSRTGVANFRAVNQITINTKKNDRWSFRAVQDLPNSA
jgi:hypothetical protein